MKTCSTRYRLCVTGPWIIFYWTIDHLVQGRVLCATWCGQVLPSRRPWITGSYTILYVTSDHLVMCHVPRSTERGHVLQGRGPWLTQPWIIFYQVIEYLVQGRLPCASGRWLVLTGREPWVIGSWTIRSWEHELPGPGPWVTKTWTIFLRTIAYVVQRYGQCGTCHAHFPPGCVPCVSQPCSIFYHILWDCGIMSYRTVNYELPGTGPYYTGL